MATLDDALNKVAELSAGLDTLATDQAAAFTKLEGEVGGTEDTQPVIDALTAAEAKVQALDDAAKTAGA